MRTEDPHLALRTIVVSARDARRSSAGDRDNLRRVRWRTAALLADLERAIVRDGADRGLLDAIADARRELL